MEPARAFLENRGITNTVSGSFLTHHGVKDMKWGVRRGGIKDRITGAHKDSLQRRITTNREIAEGRGQKRDYGRVAVFRPVGWGTFKSKKVAAVRVKQLEARAERVASGKTKASDILDRAFNTNVSDVIISRTDARG